MKVLYLASTSSAPNFSSTSRRMPTRLCLPYCLTSPPPTAVALLLWVILLDHQTTNTRTFLAPGCWSPMGPYMAWMMLMLSALSCALASLSFIILACPLSHIQHSAAEFDCAIQCTLETIIGIQVSHWLWLKASVPCSCSGLNLRSAPSLSLWCIKSFVIYLLPLHTSPPLIPAS